MGWLCFIAVVIPRQEQCEGDRVHSGSQVKRKPGRRDGRQGKAGWQGQEASAFKKQKMGLYSMEP